jgi:hypothetical protein
MYLNLAKRGLGNILGDFFTKASVHPGKRQQEKRGVSDGCAASLQGWGMLGARVAR